MVGRYPTTRDPSLDLSPPKLDDLSSYLLDPSYDFDPIEEWLLEPDHLPMMAGEIKDPSAIGSDLKSVELGVCNPDVSDLTRVEKEFPQESELKKGCFDVGMFNTEEIVDGGNQGVNECHLVDLGLSEELLGKVSLVGDSAVGVLASCEGVPVNSSLSNGIERFKLDGHMEVVDSKGNDNRVTGVGVPIDGNGVPMDSGVSDGKDRDGSNVHMEVVNLKKNVDAENEVSLVTTSVDVDKHVADENDSESSGTECDGCDSEASELVGFSSSSSSSSSSSGISEEDSEGEEKHDGDEDIDDGGCYKKGMDEVVEVEEGEIRDLNQEELDFSSDDEEERVTKGPIRSKNEVEFLSLVPPVDVALESHHQTLPVGVISSIMGTRVIVEGLVKHNPLNEGSILWITETRSPLGLVDEIFGPVKNPYYVVRYNSDKEVPVGISEGTAISFVMDFAHHIVNEQVLHKKGYDASGENDEEVDEEVEFSDDEKEAEYKRSLRQTKRGKGKQRQGKQEAFNKKRVQFKGAGIRENVQPLRHATAVPGQLPPSVPSQLQAPAVGGNFSGGSCTSSFGAEHACGTMALAIPPIPQAVHQSDCLGVPHQNLLMQQPNAVWLHGMPSQQQQQNMGAYGGFMMMPCQQLQQQHQHQFFPGFSSGIQYQQQFGPNQGVPPNVAWLGGLVNPSAGSMGLGSLGQGGFSQAPCGGTSVGEQGASGLYNQQGYGQLPPAFGQSDMRPPMQFNFGTSPVRGRKPYQRGGGRYPFGRSGQPRNG